MIPFFTVVFGVLPIFKERITCFVFLSLWRFLYFSRFFVTSASKTHWFDFQQVFIIKIEFLEWKTGDKNLQTQQTENYSQIPSNKYSYY